MNIEITSEEIPPRLLLSQTIA